MKQAHVLYYRRGPAWLDGRSVFEQPLQAHLAYMRQLKADQVLTLGGPFTDDTGGLVVVQAESVSAARALADADPAVKDGVMVVEVHPWKVLSEVLS